VCRSRAPSLRLSVVLEGEDAARSCCGSRSRDCASPASPAGGRCRCARAPCCAGMMLLARARAASKSHSQQVEAPAGPVASPPAPRRALSPSQHLRAAHAYRHSVAPAEPVAVLGRALPPVSADAGWFLDDADAQEPPEPPGARFFFSLGPFHADSPDMAGCSGTEAEGAGAVPSHRSLANCSASSRRRGTSRRW
jgi:hypothetical protein